MIMITNTRLFRYRRPIQGPPCQLLCDDAQPNDSHQLSLQLLTLDTRTNVLTRPAPMSQHAARVPSPPIVGLYVRTLG